MMVATTNLSELLPMARSVLGLDGYQFSSEREVREYQGATEACFT